MSDSREPTDEERAEAAEASGWFWGNTHRKVLAVIMQRNDMERSKDDAVDHLVRYMGRTEKAEAELAKAAPEGPPNEQVHSDGTVYTKTVKKSG